MGGGGSTDLNYSYSLRGRIGIWMDLQIQCTGHHNDKQRRPVYVCSMGGPLQQAGHLSCDHNRLPPAVKWDCRAYGVPLELPG